MKKRKYIIASALFFAGVLAYLTTTGMRTPEVRNIVLISIDTCRADYLSCYGYPRETTPHIDAVARHATRFENVISPVPLTLPAHCSMLTGTIPPVHGVHRNVGYELAPANNTLPEMLKQKGFGSSAIVSTFVLDKARGLDQGFDSYDDTFRTAHYNLEAMGNERKGAETTQVALEWLEKNKGAKSFLLLHYYDPHLVYEPPEPFATQFADNLYAGEIAFVDHCIGQVIQKLKELEIYDSTLLIITADHGEMLGEHGEDEHGYFIYESAIKVPLIVKLPGQKKAATISHPVGLVDIVPTLCSMLDISTSTRVQGKDLTSLLKGNIPEAYERFIYSESATPNSVGASSLMAVSTDQWKYIQAPRPELYDLSSDPGEVHNLITKERHRVRILEDKLLEILEQAVRLDQDSRIELDSESIRRLESLGYVGGTEEEEIVFDRTKPDPKDFIFFYSQFHAARKLKNEGEYRKAQKILTDLIPQMPPKCFAMYSLLSDIAMRLGEFDQSIINYRRCMEIDPTRSFPRAFLNNLSWLQSTRPSLPSRRPDEALLLAKKICQQTNFNFPDTLDTLAVAYAANGDFPKAIETAQKAIKLADAAKNKKLAEEILERLKLFEKSEPYLEE